MNAQKIVVKGKLSKDFECDICGIEQDEGKEAMIELSPNELIQQLWDMALYGYPFSTIKQFIDFAHSKGFEPDLPKPQQEFCECKDPDFQCVICEKWMKPLLPESKPETCGISVKDDSKTYGCPHCGRPIRRTELASKEEIIKIIDKWFDGCLEEDVHKTPLRFKLLAHALVGKVGKIEPKKQTFTEDDFNEKCSCGQEWTEHDNRKCEIWHKAAKLPIPRKRGSGKLTLKDVPPPQEADMI